MEQLSNIIINLSAQHPNLLDKLYRVPSITAFNRLEPRARSENFERSLRAEVRDALWMLTRQWQMGELDAEDAGSPIDARIATSEVSIDRIALKENLALAYNEQVPMEAYVEKEPVPFTHSLKVQAGNFFLRLHSETLRNKYLDSYRNNFGVDKTPDYEKLFRSQPDAYNVYLSTRSSALDGEKILKAIMHGTLITTAAIDASDEPEIIQAGNDFVSWYKRQYYQPENVADNAWDTEQLDYTFTVAGQGRQGVEALHADEYFGGRLDWYSFDKQLRPPGNITDIRHTPTTVREEVISFIPVTPSFKGIPHARFWEMEDRQVDFGKTNMKKTDHLLMLFTEFGLIYANDWFVIPYKMPVNTLCEIEGLVVTDVFGDRIIIEHTGTGAANWENWSLFTLSNLHNIGRYNRQFLLPACLTQSLESDPIERVNFMRDEMANMCWGIESIIPDQMGTGIDGDLAADKTGVIPEPVIPDPEAKIRYLLGTTVPENWIPFVPVHKPGSVQDIRFRRAAMPKLGSVTADLIRGRGRILTEKASPYYVNEEEIPYSGTIVERKFQRTRWLNGKTYCWLGRTRETGRGQGNSGLMFDQIL